MRKGTGRDAQGAEMEWRLEVVWKAVQYLSILNFI
jgi:hypothetical protein